MIRRASFTLAVLIIASTLTAESLYAESRPNVVYIMADDVGWGDISSHGGGVPTPNID